MKFIFPPLDEPKEELLLEARLAMERMDNRKDESIEVWAHRLGNDLGKFTD